MTRVSEPAKPFKPSKPTTMIVCTRGGKPLTEQDKAELEKYMEFRIARALKKKPESPELLKGTAES